MCELYDYKNDSLESVNAAFEQVKIVRQLERLLDELPKAKMNTKNHHSIVALHLQ